MRFSCFWGAAGLIALAASVPTTKRATGKPVFAHYMIGEIYDEHTRQDIVDAKALGLDAFALNFDQFASWSEDTVDRLFSNADELGFGLFFSFDHAAGHLTDPSQYTEYLKKYTTRTSYFEYDGRPLVSTFGGENINNDQWISFKSSVGSILLIPGFYQNPPASSIFTNTPALDGVFNWNSWPDSSAGRVTVPTVSDTAYQSAASSASKLFMMGMSPIQFKHLSTSQNWYRRGEQNLEYRFAQVLSLQPDMLQLQTWNDAGESHYMGNLWEEPMTSSPIHGYTDGYDHKGYWNILKSFIEAWKRGDMSTANMVPTNDKAVQGAFWHHTLLVGASCGVGGLDKSLDVTNNVEDAVSGVVLVEKGRSGLMAVVNVGGNELGKMTLVEGFNRFKFTGLTTGKVQLEVWDGSNMIGGGYAPIEVANAGTICNYNFQVVGFPG
ncbi:glycoside hydrolase [Clohesyomyces aquaticus]|uniref:Glycoside hydrolase n=1 Tax=Clohesyomyces aquaticus TaxID=1231657 RepID=A0A1Y1ZJ27_9PLEO|nr:glycoside hydrolase [Clohesyomyces aquaticus]